MVARNYRKQVNDAMTKQSQSLERSSSGLAFSKLSDNVSAGSRAMYIQEQRYAATQQLNNVKDLMAEQKSIDSNLSSIHSILQTIQERMLKGMSEDWGESSRQVIAQEIGQKMEQLLQFANAQYAGHTLFGGTNNSVNPFTVDENTGKLQYNGVNVEDIFKGADGKYYYYPGKEDPAHPGSFQYTFDLSGGGIDGTFTAYGDGSTFHLDDQQSNLKYTMIDGEKYYSDAAGTTFTSASGKTFEVDGTGFKTVVIDGVTYVKDPASNYYYEEGVDPTYKPGIVGKVFESADGLTFTEMETELVDDPNGTEHIPNVEVKGPKSGGVVKTFEVPTEDGLIEEPLEFKARKDGGFDQVVIGDTNGKPRNYVKTGVDENGRSIYTSTDPYDKSVYVSDNGRVFTQTVDANGNEINNGVTYTFSNPQKVQAEEPVEVPNSGNTYADIGLGLKIAGDNADPRTAYQANFSGLAFMGCAGFSDTDPPTHPGPRYGVNGTELPGNIYDLLAKVKDALYPDFNKNALDDYYTQLVNLTDEVGMVRTDLGNRMQYLELTETRLDEDIYNMTTLETDLISSDPAEEAIKMKEVEYVWLALMQLGSKVLPASLLDFMS